MSQIIFVVLSDPNQLPLDLKSKLQSNIQVQNTSPFQFQTQTQTQIPISPLPTPIPILPDRPIITQTRSPALRVVTYDKPYNYQVGPLEYFAGKWSQLW